MRRKIRAAFDDDRNVMATLHAPLTDSASAAFADLPDEELLAEGLREGKVEAFEVLFKTYRSPVYNLVLRMVHDPQEAEDVTQEVFLKAFRQIPQQGEEFRLRPWLYRVTTFTCFDHLRRRRRRPQVGDVDPETIPASHDQYEQADLATQIELALQRLDERQRAALVLKDLHGLRHDEIAGVLGISGGAAATLLFRARRAFAQAFVRGPAGDRAARGCPIARRAAALFVDREASPREKRLLVEHARTCPECRRALRLAQTQAHGLGLFLTSVDPPMGLGDSPGVPPWLLHGLPTPSLPLAGNPAGSSSSSALPTPGPTTGPVAVGLLTRVGTATLVKAALIALAIGAAGGLSVASHRSPQAAWSVASAGLRANTARASLTAEHVSSASEAFADSAHRATLDASSPASTASQPTTQGHADSEVTSASDAPEGTGGSDQTGSVQEVSSDSAPETAQLSVHSSDAQTQTSTDTSGDSGASAVSASDATVTNEDTASADTTTADDTNSTSTASSVFEENR